MTTGDWIAIIFGVFAGLGVLVTVITWFVSMHLTVKNTEKCLNDENNGLVAISTSVKMLTNQVSEHTGECDVDRESTREDAKQTRESVKSNTGRIIALEG